MHTALRALLGHLIDYAGLFPPATLDMQPMVDNYARYLSGDDAWMLNRVIVPVSRLEEFERCAVGLLPTEEDGEPWLISALTRRAGDKDLVADIEAIEAFNEHHRAAAAGLAEIDVIELKAATATEIDAALNILPDALFPFVELPVSDDPRGLVAALVGSDAGAKIRTGGVTGDLYPDVEAVARFIVACCGAGVPFKGTAGMHHPLRHYCAAVQATEHGFLNVFIAACVAEVEPDDPALIREVLSIESDDEFSFTDEGIEVKDVFLGAEQIERTRALRAISFGSCSFDEPREDLRSLGLFETAAH